MEEDKGILSGIGFGDRDSARSAVVRRGAYGHSQSAAMGGRSEATVAVVVVFKDCRLDSGLCVRLLFAWVSSFSKDTGFQDMVSGTSQQ